MSTPVDIESLVEAYVRRPSSLSQEQISYVERLLRDDPTVRAVRDYLARFHSELESLSRETPVGVEEFTARLFRTGPIRLCPVPADRPVGPTVLAAHTAPPPVQARHRLLAVLSGRPDEPVIRLLDDREEGVIRAYVIGLDRLPAVLSVPGLGEAVAVDPEGRALFSRPRRPGSWDDLSAHLHPAAGSCTFSGHGERFVAGTRIRYVADTRGAVLEFEGPADFVLCSSGGRMRVGRLVDGRARLPISGGDANPSVWVCP